jgi:hypothetical protein
MTSARVARHNDALYVAEGWAMCLIAGWFALKQKCMIAPPPWPSVSGSPRTPRGDSGLRSVSAGDRRAYVPSPGESQVGPLLILGAC